MDFPMGSREIYITLGFGYQNGEGLIQTGGWISFQKIYAEHVKEGGVGIHYAILQVFIFWPGPHEAIPGKIHAAVSFNFRDLIVKDRTVNGSVPCAF